MNTWKLTLVAAIATNINIFSLPALAQTPKLTTAKPATTKTTKTAPVKVSPVLEQQILEVISKNPDILVEVLQKYAIEQQKKEQIAQAEALKKLRQDLKGSIGDSPTQGATDRRIVLMEFADFQCSFCAKTSESIKQFMTKHKGKVTLVYKNFPLTQIHPEALPAARAAWAAGRQGKFWEYHDALFSNQAKLGEKFYLETATKLKLDLNKFNADRPAADKSIVAEFTLGRKLGIEGTPTIIMNGEVVSGAVTVADLEKILAKVSKN